MNSPATPLTTLNVEHSFGSVPTVIRRKVSVHLGGVALALIAGLTPLTAAMAEEGGGSPPTIASQRLIAAGGCAIVSSSVKCWGPGFYGQTGSGTVTEFKGGIGDQPGEMGAALTPVNLGTGAVPIAVVSGGTHRCALLSTGAVKCWGWSNFGQAGIGKTGIIGLSPGTPSDGLAAADLGANARALSAGFNFNCAIVGDGSVKCWGNGFGGQLGTGNQKDVGLKPGQMGAALRALPLGGGAIAVSAGGNHACAVLVDATVKCWGYGAMGQLGQGSKANIGDKKGQMDKLSAIALPGPAVAVAAGGKHTCALLSSGQVVCWGLGSFGQLGGENTASIGDQPGEMGTALSAVRLGGGHTATAIATGALHTCALLDNGDVKCWGDGSKGQLGSDSPKSFGTTTGSMGDTLPVVNLGRAAKAISANGNSTCALLDNGDVKCWGGGFGGANGNGSAADLGNKPGQIEGLRPLDLGGSVGSGSTASAASPTPAVPATAAPTFTSAPTTVSVTTVAGAPAPEPTTTAAPTRTITPTTVTAAPVTRAPVTTTAAPVTRAPVPTTVVVRTVAPTTNPVKP